MALHCSNCGKALGDDAHFCSACGRPVANPSASPWAYRPPLMRSRAGRKIAGVCQGIANRMVWDVTFLRVLAVVLAFLTFPLGIIVYFVFWLVMPEEPLTLFPATPVNTVV